MAVQPRVTWLVALSLTCMLVAGAQAQSSASGETPFYGVQTRESDLALAESYYQRGATAEAQSDNEFRVWVRTIDSTRLDYWVNRANFCVEMYRNAIRLNPAHAKAHERLAYMFHETRGTQANNELSIMHFVSFLALEPNYGRYPQAKGMLDELLRTYIDSTMFVSNWANGFIYGALTDENSPYAAMSEFQGILARMAQQQRRDVLGGISTLALLKPGVYTEAEAMGLPDHRAIEGFRNQLPDIAGGLTDPDRAEFERAVLLSAAYVEHYLMMIGQMTEWMKYLDRYDVSYDPRLPRMLVGEAVVQLRRHFLRNSSGDSVATLGRLRTEVAGLDAVGGITARDLWSVFDLTKPVPDQWLASETMEEADKDQAEYDALRALIAVPMPDEYDPETPEPAAGGMGGAMGAPMGGPMMGSGGSGGMMGPGGMGGGMGQTTRFYPSESHLVTYDLASSEAYKAYLLWRTAHLVRATRALGFTRIDDFFVDRVDRVASGEFSVWQPGALLTGTTTIGALPDTDETWLLSSN